MRYTTYSHCAGAERVADAVRDSVATAIAAVEANPPDLADVAAFTEQWQGAGRGRIKTSLGPHSPYACLPVFLARTAAVAARLGVGIRLRASESAEQVDMSLLAYDMTPMSFAPRSSGGLPDTLPAASIHASVPNAIWRQAEALDISLGLDAEVRRERTGFPEHGRGARGGGRCLFGGHAGAGCHCVGQNFRWP